MITKSSIMLGLGESDEEVKEAMQDLRAIGVDILTLGQYLQPTPLHLTVKEYVTPEKFSFWKEYGESIGFRYVASGPLVMLHYAIVLLLLMDSLECHMEVILTSKLTCYSNLCRKFRHVFH
ncbi:Lipoyl synthase 1 [Nymphaea thermarum]|nr:Lipoyl synthase 1 [Nymphaea thermarum]